MKAVTPADRERLDAIRRAIVVGQLVMQENEERLGYWLDYYADTRGLEASAPSKAAPPQRSTKPRSETAVPRPTRK